jgi:N6-L-threonylcarbamoyladenine synthase
VLGLSDAMDAAPRARWKLDEQASVPTQFANTRANF